MSVWHPERVVTEEEAAELIERQFPQLAPVTAIAAGEGFDNTAYRVNGAYVFRFPRRESAVELLRAECALLPALGALEQPLAIPTSLLLGAPEERYPWPFAGYRYVPGRPPRVGNDEGRRRSVERLAAFLRALHAYPAESAKRLGVPGSDPVGRFVMPAALERLQAREEEAAALGLWHGGEALESLIAGLDGVNVRSYRETLLHGDLHLRNVLEDEQGELNGVIDWGDAHIGHPALDLAIAYSYVPVSERERFFCLYGAVDADTRKLARFRAVFTLVVLLLYGHDRGDDELAAVSREGLARALAGPL
ncbi:phosphotransferase [Paenibacillus athensensis]|uniref:Aminoglycoside phosphotransferase domain-containing protein n=1 Tax=Paenibacillus athensensis TaxID=1967502 RepID=A0A4Y8QA27_9BACL|nr:phosphotransferase [Paenibacillus athensensis]MCD1260108.1 phosphotransferase [Paenibacillus athensensis]